MTRAEEAAVCLRRWWEIRQPAELAEFGITTHVSWQGGRWGVSFGWRDYLNERQQTFARLHSWEEAIETAAALLNEIHALRARAQKKPAERTITNESNRHTSAA